MAKEDLTTEVARKGDVRIMKTRIFRKDILLILTYYAQGIQRLQTSRTRDGYEMGSGEYDKSHVPPIFMTLLEITL